MSILAIPTGRSTARRVGFAGGVETGLFVGRERIGPERRGRSKLIWREFVGLFGVILALVVAVFA